MRYTFRQIRVILLAFAIALACSAVFAQHWLALPQQQSYVTSGTFSCSLLPETVSLYDIQATVGALEFQGAVGAKVTADEVSGETRSFRLSTYHSEQRQAEDSFEQASSLLELKLKSLAVSEVDASRAYVEQLREEVRERRRTPAEDTLDFPVAALSPEDEARVRLLSRENSEIRSFLKGGAKPEWLPARFDRPAIERAERRVAREKETLLTLTAKWTNENRAVQAQAQQLEKARADLLALQKHLAKIMLTSQEAELKRLEDKDLSIVKANAERSRQNSDAKPAEAEEPSPAAAWLREHSYKLDERARTLEKRASLTRLTGPATSLEQASGYWVAMGLWTLSLMALMSALFLPRPKGYAPSAREAGPAGRPFPDRAAVLGHAVALAPLPAEPPLSAGGEVEVFFRNLQHQMEKQTGRSPSCILVLGASHAGSRSSLSLRLAKNFNNARRSVKLIDFDLKERPLSQRIGDEASPGVTDLLTYSGPVEEFFASVPGTAIQFAPAGTSRVLREQVSQQTLKALVRRPENGVTLIDASFASPLHLLLGEIDVVLCLTRPGTRWTEQEQQVLLAFREAGMPVWGIAHGDSQIYPFI